MNLYQNFRCACERYRDNPAILFKGEITTYHELLLKVNQALENLYNFGIHPEARVGLILNNSVDLVTCIFALAGLKALSCLIGPSSPDYVIIDKIKSANVEIVILEAYTLTPALLQFLESNKIRIILRGKDSFKISNSICLSNILDQGEGHNYIYTDTADEDAILIQSSSGTTGGPKLAYRTHQNIESDIRNIIKTFTYSEQAVVYCPVPISHGYGLTMGLLATNEAGGLLILENLFMPNHFYRRKNNISIFLGTPTILKILCRANIPSNTFDNMSWVFSSSEPLAWDTANSFYHRFHRWPNQMYGMMEVSTIAANLDPNKENVLSVGQPLDGIQLKFEQGTIYVKGKTVSTQYIKYGKTIKAIDEGEWFCTKDTGYQDKNGYIYLCGRTSV